MTLVEESLPEHARLVTPNSHPVTVRYGMPVASAPFDYELILPGPKPVKDVFREGPQSASRTIVPPAGLPRVVIPQAKKPPTRARRVIVRTGAHANRTSPL